ncbi:transcriptional regulator [Roseomonas nepalensis]|uniref:Transcriptional regulator n=1 Tax=Muricoccus nepalensis TaxID=1854500 RepID=A0A502FT08_9PROT|nr:transcriptional regulator [Roseomonas nepalensis]
MSPVTCRAARALLAWPQQQLASAANIGLSTVKSFEGGNTLPRRTSLDAMQRALEAAGVTFTNGGEPGVKLRKAGS